MPSQKCLYQVCEKYQGYGYPCSDRDGYPVLYSPFGSMDVEGLMKSISSVDYIRQSFKHVEEGLTMADKVAIQVSETRSFYVKLFTKYNIPKETQLLLYLHK